MVSKTRQLTCKEKSFQLVMSRASYFLYTFNNSVSSLPQPWESKILKVKSFSPLMLKCGRKKPMKG
jgi:hypothetical protein